MFNAKFKFVLEYNSELYYSDIVKSIDEIIEHTYLLEELIEDGAYKQGNIALNDAFMDKDWVIKYKLLCTGLKDKTGRDIYAGDIVIIESVLYEVAFHGGAFHIRDLRARDENFGEDGEDYYEYHDEYVAEHRFSCEVVDTIFNNINYWRNNEN